MQITNERYKKNPSKFGPKSVIGLYLRTMNMMQYRDFHYSDSDTLDSGNAATAPIAQAKIDEEYEAKLVQQLKNGEITQTQYDTLTKKNAVKYDADLDEEGFIKGLKALPLNTYDQQDQPEPETPQEQTPQYQFDPTY